MRRSRVLVLGTALWLLCVAAVAGVLATGRTQERQALFDRFGARADTGASFVAAYVDDVFATEHRLAARVLDDRSPREEFAATVELMGFSAAVLLDRQGRALALAPHDPRMHGVDMASRYAHLSAALSGRRSVSDIVSSAVEGRPIVAFALPLSDASTAVLSAGFSLERGPLKAFLERQPITGTRGYVVDSTGTVIVSAGEGAVAAGGLLDVPAEQGDSVSGGRFTATAPIPGTRWTYVLDAPVAAIVAPLHGSVEEWTVLAGLAAVTLLGLVVTAAAMASRARARESQAEADRRFRLTVEHAPIGMTMVSPDLRFVEPNARLCQMLGYSSDELESMTFPEVTFPADLDLDLEKVQGLLRGETDSYELDKRYVRRDGSVLWGRLTVGVVRDDHGDPLYFVSQIEDVTALRAAQEDLERRALFDPLTGLANRGLLVDRLESVLKRRGPVDAAVAFCDLDLFKAINDEHGHHAGDAVLQAVAQRLAHAVREGDTVARMGGDEFVILLTDVGTLAEAEAVVERARSAVAGSPVEFEGLSVTVGMSAGLTLADPADSAGSLMRRADAALYAAKRAGRGGLAVHPAGETELPVGATELLGSR